MNTKIGMVIALIGLALAPAAQAAEAPNPFANLRLGLFTHYAFAGGDYDHGRGWTHLSPTDCRPVPDLHTLAHSFDARKYAEAAAAMRAQYVIFTLFHARINVLYPSAYWEKVLPGHTARRDVIRELISELKARHIRLVLYFHPVDGHDLYPAEQEKTRWFDYKSGRDLKPWNDLMNGLMEDVGRRYGADVEGFWLDGGPAPDHFDGPRFKATIRKYSPRAVVWMNGRWFPGLSDLVGSEQPDGTIPLASDTDEWTTDQNQAAVVFGGQWWSVCGKVTQTPEKMLRYTVRLAGTLEQANGGIAWAASPFANNEWESGVLATMTAFGKLLAPLETAVFGTRPSTSYVTHAGTLQKSTWGVATDAADGKAVFLHVLNPPGAGLPLRIPKPADGRVFRTATMVPSGRPVALARSTQGYSLKLGGGDTWNAADTVIRLEVEHGSK